MNDRDIVSRILNGDEAAKEELVQAFGKRLFRAACTFLGYNDADAEDAVQETFLAGFRDMHKFEFRSSLYLWFNHICVNRCFRRLRERRRTLVGLDEEIESAERRRSMEFERNKRHESVEEEQKALVWSLVSSLKKKCREIIELRHQQGLPYGEIGESLKLPIGTVMSRLARCRKALKDLVRGELEGSNHG